MRLWPASVLLLLAPGCGDAPDDTAAAEVCEPGWVCPIGGTGELGFNGDGLPARETRLASPTAVTTDPDGRPVVVDYSNMRVRVLDDAGRLVTLAGDGVHAYSEIGALATESPLENPIDATWGPDGLLYILPQHEGRVIRVEPDGTLSRYAGTGELADTGDDGPALEARMGFGGGMAFAPDGTLFVSDNSYSRVRRVTPSGAIDTVLGTGEGGLGAPGYGPEVAIRSPERVAVTPDGAQLLVADTLNHRVLSVDLDDLTVTVLAGTGERGFSGDGGPATAAQLSSPVGVLPAPSGAILIADLENDVIRAISPDDGTIQTVIGTPGAPAVAPSPAAAPLRFSLRRPAGMAWTPEGDLLIAERSGHRILSWQGAADAL